MVCARDAFARVGIAHHRRHHKAEGVCATSGDDESTGHVTQFKYIQLVSHDLTCAMLCCMSANFSNDMSTKIDLREPICSHPTTRELELLY